MQALMRILATTVIVAIACAGVYELWDYYMFSPWTRDARVRADVVTIAPDVSGYIDDLRVKDNAAVKKGDVLFTIDQERYKRALATADANVAARRAEMTMRKSQAERRAKLTELAISQEGRENAELVAASAAATYEQALADRSTASLNLARTVVRAPVSGFVTNLGLVVGQYVGVGTRVMALIDQDSYRVEGYFEETKIPMIRVGDHVDIHLLDGGPTLRGHVNSISKGITDRDNANGPELLANVNPTFEWVRLAQRIPVRIQIDEVPDGVLISSGMTCTVTIPTPRRNWALALLVHSASAQLAATWR